MDSPDTTFEDLRSTFIEYISVMPMVYNNENVLRAYERVFDVMDKLEKKYGN